MRWDVPKLWDGGECWIIGGGYSMPSQFKVPPDIIEAVCKEELSPSAYSPYLEALHDRHVIGINNAYLIGTWIDVVFFGDGSWSLAHRRKLSKWPGIKVTCAPKFSSLPKDKMWGVKYVMKDAQRTKGISLSPSRVSWNGNSGAAAISLAANFGVRRIFLLGFDMYRNHKYTHWHGSHGKNPKKMPYGRHLKGFPQIAEDAKQRKIEILNVNMESKIEDFPRITLEEALSFGSP